MSEEKKSNDESKKLGLRKAIVAQFFGMIGMYSFRNGIVLLYMTVIGIDPIRILVYLAIPNFLSTIFRLPVAYTADRYGKKRLGSIGVFLTFAGYAALPIAGFFDQITAEIFIVIGFVVLALGKLLFASGWFALLSPLVPEERRGRIFGSMRFLYQIGGIIFSGICAYLLSKDAPIYIYQVITGIITFCFFLRFILYQRVPEIEKQTKPTGTFFKTISEVTRIEGYAGFCSYIFLLTLFTAGCGSLFTLIEKSVLNLNSGFVVLLANAGMFGGLAGLFFGGRLIDKWGTKYVFISCHLGFALGITGFIMRDSIPLPISLSLLIIHFFMGTIGAASGIAFMSEILGIVPKENKALSTSLGTSMVMAGMSLSGLISAAILKLDILKKEWVLLGNKMCQYDAILLGYACMIILMIVAIGQVPSVIRKQQWMPREQ